MFNKNYGSYSYVLSYIKRWFFLVAAKKKHINFSDDLLKKLLSCNALNIMSLVEVFNAENDWIKHDTKERNTFAIDLIKNIRLF